MRKLILPIVILSSLIFTNCIGVAIKKEIMPNYYLIAVDDDKQLDLSYHEDIDENNYGTVIPGTVIALGFNDKYIIAKQKPYIDFKQNDTLLYYILPIKKGMNWRTKNNMLGPLTLNEFKAKQKELKIMDIKFKDVDDF